MTREKQLRMVRRIILFRSELVCLGWAALAVAVIVLIVISAAHAHEWSSDPKTRGWFQSLRQNDNPYISCCGEADSYLADQYEVAPDGSYIAIITDERDDLIPAEIEDSDRSEDGVNTSTAPHIRQHRAVGTRIYVPPAKVGCTKPNPTGHGVLFMPQLNLKNVDDGLNHAIVDADGDPIIPYCFCPPAGY